MADELDENANDQLVAITKGVTSLLPLVGGVVGEIVGVTIPNQRADRIVKYLRELGDRITTLEEEQQTAIKQDPERIDLVEEGGFQAARATTDERIGQIAEAVFNGLKSDQVDVVRRKRLVTLLGQVDNDELILLNAYGQSYGGDGEDAWDKVNRPEPTHMGSPADDLDREQLFEAGRENLLRLGLLEKKYQAKRGQMPEFDTFKNEFKHRVEISHLGRLLLREVGLPTPFDQES